MSLASVTPPCATQNVIAHHTCTQTLPPWCLTILPAVKGKTRLYLAPSAAPSHTRCVARRQRPRYQVRAQTRLASACLAGLAGHTPTVPWLGFTQYPGPWPQATCSCTLQHPDVLAHTHILFPPPYSYVSPAATTSSSIQSWRLGLRPSCSVCSPLPPPSATSQLHD